MEEEGEEEEEGEGKRWVASWELGVHRVGVLSNELDFSIL